MTPITPTRSRIIDETGILMVRSAIREVARKIGFDLEVTEELVIVVSELGSNILKYGKRGHIDLFPSPDESGKLGISIVAYDESPPFDLAASLRDGYAATGKIDPAHVFRRGGLAVGLGAVHRFSDRLELVPEQVGKRIVAWRAISRARRGSSPSF